jgi:uroporphyrinogen-III synthase
MATLLVLRPEPGASATVAKARERGLEALAAPLFELEAVPWETPDPGAFDGLLLTSANAVRCAGEQIVKLRGLSAYAVGEATADTARDAGFDIASIGNAGVDQLLQSIEPALRLLHLSGEDRRGAERARQSISPIVVYRSRPIESPRLPTSPETIALIHSPRAGSRFAELVAERAGISIAAISEAAANATGHGWKSIAVADQPSDDALLALAARLCNNPPPK